MISTTPRLSPVSGRGRRFRPTRVLYYPNLETFHRNDNRLQQPERVDDTDLPLRWRGRHPRSDDTPRSPGDIGAARSPRD